jgi:hypothetical protein
MKIISPLNLLDCRLCVSCYGVGVSLPGLSINRSLGQKGPKFPVHSSKISCALRLNFLCTPAKFSVHSGKIFCALRLQLLCTPASRPVFRNTAFLRGHRSVDGKNRYWDLISALVCRVMGLGEKGKSVALNPSFNCDTNIRQKGICHK